jgi:hypothetical protein
MRIVIRGGSIAAGYGVTKSYVGIVKDQWNDAEIINRSYYKDTSFNGIRTFDYDIDPFKPDLLIIHFGIDDAFQAVYRSEFKENLVQIVRLARVRFNPEIALLTSHPFDNLYDMEMIYGYYRIIREVADDCSCTWIPIHAFWRGCIVEQDIRLSHYLQDDCRYPNERGHELYAGAVLERLHNWKEH